MLLSQSYSLPILAKSEKLTARLQRSELKNINWSQTSRPFCYDEQTNDWPTEFTLTQPCCPELLSVSKSLNWLASSHEWEGRGSLSVRERERRGGGGGQRSGGSALCVCALGTFNQIRLTIAVSTHTHTHTYITVGVQALKHINTVLWELLSLFWTFSGIVWSVWRVIRTTFTAGESSRWMLMKLNDWDLKLT